MRARVGLLVLALLFALRSERGAVQATLGPPGERSIAEWVGDLATPPPARSDDPTTDELSRELDYIELRDAARKEVRKAGEGALPALVEALAKAQDAAVIRELSESLIVLGKAASAAVPVLQRRLAKGPEGAHCAVAAALGRIDSRPDTPALPFLEACLTDRSNDNSLRLSVIFALDDIGGGAGATALVATLSDEDPLLQEWAIHALDDAPDATVRAPLEKLLRDDDPDVRLTAAARLLAAPLPASDPVMGPALETMARDLCRARVGTAAMALGRDREARDLPGSALAAFAAGLASPAPLCRQATAVLLAQLDPPRATRVLPRLEEAIRGSARDLRYHAARALAGMGCAARGQLPALVEAAKTDPELESSAQLLAAAPSYPEHCPLESFTLLATFDTPAKGTQAVLRLPKARQFSVVQKGDRFFDGEVERVTPGALFVRQRRIGEDLAMVEESRRIALFGDRTPQSIPPGENGGWLMDIDFEGDVIAFVSLLARGPMGAAAPPPESPGASASGAPLHLILAPEASGTVRMVARRTPWARVLEHGLEASGVSQRRLGSFLIVGKAGDRPLERQPVTIGTREELNLSLASVDLRDFARLFDQAFGVELELPAGPHPPLTIFCDGAIWQDIVEALLISRGWTHRVEDQRIVIVD